MNRLRELDFLRGAAILLVLLRHQYLFDFTKSIGWIGVDLFFVLSGFLVSGLLFKEYLQSGTVRPGRFLIRRGFKIYPIYFLFYPLYLIPILASGHFNAVGFIADMTFSQNYVNAWGYAYAASWSLAVEEHFYFSFLIFLWLGLKYKKIVLQKTEDSNSGISYFEITILLIMLLCLLLRIFSNMVFPLEYSRNFTMTHLRIDSLLAGVFIAYLYHFKLAYFKKIFQSYKYIFYLVGVLGLSWVPFFDSVISFFAKTFGLTLLYTSFGILLTYFLLTPHINQKLNRVFTAAVVNLVSKIGYCSYSIYIIHTFIDKTVKEIISSYDLYNNIYLNFLLTAVLNVVIGIFMTYKIEKFFLKIRDKHYPSPV
jgi:peptidoglycan/LPS O-acetylase OafA/YrhL